MVRVPESVLTLVSTCVVYVQHSFDKNYLDFIFYQMSFIRNSFRIKRDPPEKLEHIKENDGYKSKIDSITDGNIQRQCRQSLRIKEGANKIYNLSRNFFQKLDAAKAILVSDQKIERVTSIYDCNGKGNLARKSSYSKSKGQITISDIKVPLLWRSINGQLFANGVYSLFCIIKAGSEVLETQLICDIENTMSDVIFNDVIQINNVDFDSKCVVELYGYAVNHSSVALVKRNSKKRNSYCDSQTQELENKKRYPFKLLGSISLSLENSAQSEYSCNLENSSYNPDCDIPLFGTLSCKFLMIPISKLKCIFQGEVNIQFLSEGNFNKSKLESYHCEIKDRTLHCWRTSSLIKELVNNKLKPLSDRDDVETADQIIPLNKETELSVEIQNNGEMQLKIGTYFDEAKTDYQEILLNSDKIHYLHEALRSHIEEIEIWNESFDFDEIVEKPTSFLRQGSVFRNSLCLK